MNATRTSKQKWHSEGVRLLHDNAQTCSVQATSHLFRFKILRRPPRSPDLTPSDVLLFPRMKTSLHGKHFKESIAQVERSLITQNKEIMASGSLSIDGKVCNWLANM